MRATMGRQLYNQTTGTAFLYVKQEGKRQTSAIVYPAMFYDNISDSLICGLHFPGA